MCEDELICDLAETYNILDMYGLPPKLVAVLCMGLHNDSRVKMHLSESKLTLEQMLYARMVDELSYIYWSKTKDGQKNRNRPISVLYSLTADKKEDTEIFLTAEDFNDAREKIIHGK